MRKLFFVILPLAICSPIAVTSCHRSAPNAAESSAASDAYYRSAIGLTEESARSRYPELIALDPSFALIVSKNLPRNYRLGKLLRFGKSRVVVEFKSGSAIAIHYISGWDRRSARISVNCGDGFTCIVFLEKVLRNSNFSRVVSVSQIRGRRGWKSHCLTLFVNMWSARQSFCLSTIKNLDFTRDSICEKSIDMLYCLITYRSQDNSTN